MREVSRHASITTLRLVNVMVNKNKTVDSSKEKVELGLFQVVHAIFEAFPKLEVLEYGAEMSYD
jgi:hypothetical protein